MDRRAFHRTMRILEAHYPLKDWTTGMTPFEVLVSTILSQSTTAANERRGLEDLRRRIGSITPDRLAGTSDEEIARAIWHAGLARQKAPRIRATAAAIRDRWDGQVERILSLPTERAREELMALPGVGLKTADVVLAMAAHGRALCKARNPRCADCPVRADCDWYRRSRLRKQPPTPRKHGSPTKG